jgi:hypothetical protein
MKIIEIDVTHDRADLTGNNADENAEKKKYLEGNPNDPRDLYHNNFKMHRGDDAERLSVYMKSVGIDTSWWEGVKIGTNDPATLLTKNDPNGQTCRFQEITDSDGTRRLMKI